MIHSTITTAKKILNVYTDRKNTICFLPLEKYPVIYAPVSGVVTIGSSFVPVVYYLKITTPDGEEVQFTLCQGSGGNADSITFMSNGDTVNAGDPIYIADQNTLYMYATDPTFSTVDKDRKYFYVSGSDGVDIYTITGIPRQTYKGDDNTYWITNNVIDDNTPAGAIAQYAGKHSVLVKYTRTLYKDGVLSSPVYFNLLHFDDGHNLQYSDFWVDGQYTFDSRDGEKKEPYQNLDVVKNNFVLTMINYDAQKNNPVFPTESPTPDVPTLGYYPYDCMSVLFLGDESVTTPINNTWYINMGNEYSRVIPAGGIGTYEYTAVAPIYDYQMGNSFFAIGSHVSSYWHNTLSSYFENEDLQKGKFTEHPRFLPFSQNADFGGKECIVWQDYTSGDAKLYIVMYKYNDGAQVKPPYTQKDGYQIEWHQWQLFPTTDSPAETPAEHTAQANRGCVYYAVRGEKIKGKGNIIPVLMMLSSHGAGMPKINNFGRYINKS